MSEALYELVIAGAILPKGDRTRVALDCRAMNKPAGDEQTPDFEQSLQQLEALITKLERGDLALAESLAMFEQGVALTRRCHAALADARQRVDVLLKDGGTAPFDPDAGSDD